MKKTDGSSVTYMVTGEEVHEDPDGRRRQINPDGSVLMADAFSTPPPVPQNTAATVRVRHVDPKELFAEHIERAKSDGNAIVSDVDKRGSRKVIFKDGGKLLLTKEGIMIHKYADGKKDQCTPSGKRVTVCYRHTIRNAFNHPLFAHCCVYSMCADSILSSK